MGMKLLTKSDIDKAKANQQKKDVDEGLKLARRIDNLREVAVQEEANLEKFRKTKVASLSAEITQLEAIKDSFTGEISQLKRERRALMKPLEAEWAEIHKEKASIRKRKDDLTALEGTIQLKDKAAREAVKQASDKLAKAITKEEAADRLIEKANSAALEATERLRHAQKIESDSMVIKAKFDKEIATRDMKMAEKERNLELKADNIKKDEMALKQEWKLLEDRKAMLETHIKIKKQ